MCVGHDFFQVSLTISVDGKAIVAKEGCEMEDPTEKDPGEETVAELGRQACRNAAADSNERQEHSKETIVERNGAACKATVSNLRVKREHGGRVNMHSKNAHGKAEPAVSCTKTQLWGESDGHKRGFDRHGDQYSFGRSKTRLSLDRESSGRQDKELRYRAIESARDCEHTRWSQGEDGMSDRGFCHHCTRCHGNRGFCHRGNNSIRPKSSHYYRGSHSGENPALRGHSCDQYSRHPYRSGDACKTRNSDHVDREQTFVSHHSNNRQWPASSQPSRSCIGGAEQLYKAPRHRQSRNSSPGTCHSKQRSVRTNNATITQSKEISCRPWVQREDKHRRDYQQSTWTRDKEGEGHSSEC